MAEKPPDMQVQHKQPPLHLLEKIGAAFAGFLLGILSARKPGDTLLDSQSHSRVRRELEDQSTRTREWQ
jgi:hypothetical protein